MVEIRWPGGPHDFRIVFDDVDTVNVKGWEDWRVLFGLVIEPSELKYRARRGFYCHPIGDGVWQMVPMQGR